MTAASLQDGTSHSPQKAGTSPLRTRVLWERRGYSFGEMRFFKLA